ncbi:hypothetical protein pipiens_000141, partial [Culex pipiens pipiens]
MKFSGGLCFDNLKRDHIDCSDISSVCATSARSGASSTRWLRSGKRPTEVLIFEEMDKKYLFQRNALLRRLVRIRVLDESRMKFDYMTQVCKLNLAKSYHRAHLLNRQRSIRIRMQKHIYFSLKLPFSGGRPGREEHAEGCRWCEITPPNNGDQYGFGQDVEKASCSRMRVTVNKPIDIPTLDQ